MPCRAPAHRHSTESPRSPTPTPPRRCKSPEVEPLDAAGRPPPGGSIGRSATWGREKKNLQAKPQHEAHTNSSHIREGAVGSRVALEREHQMRGLENGRYLAVVVSLARRPASSMGSHSSLRRESMAAAPIELLELAAAAGHKESRDDAEQYIWRACRGRGRGGTPH